MLIVDYQEKWVRNFEEIKKILSNQLVSIKIQIEHIGSTAVPLLPAKPIIDIDTIYFDLSDFEKIKIKLEELRYYHNGNQGIEGREVFKRKNEVNNKVLDSIRHHLYVCHHESRELKHHLLFRDYLRSNQKARKQYEKLKYELAEKASQDKNIYALLKEQKANDFISDCIRKQKLKHGK
ncbi:GrpB family protein [Ekhidna sp.]|uniref:GrpB family protein n=1 Tax=Ekhidna sp. TaxID=2608089 RepID=UPI003515903D